MEPQAGERHRKIAACRDGPERRAKDLQGRDMTDLKALAERMRGEHATADAIDAAADLLDQMASAEPVAVRHCFDGHGWLYIDGGSGSDWLTRHADGEPLYAAPQPAPIPADTALMQRALDALAESLGTVEHEYVFDWRHGMPTREAQLAAMKAENDALREDAARYRWLVDDHQDSYQRNRQLEILDRLAVMTHSSASAAIDAARKGEA